MSRKFSVSSISSDGTPDYDASDPSIKPKAYQMNETSKGVELHEPDRKYSFSKVSTALAKSFLHPPDRIIVGRVIFKAKYLGYLMVKEPKGVPIVKAAVEKIKVAAEVKRINDSSYKDPEVDLCISIRALTTVDKASKDVIIQHSLPLVSFSADVRRSKHEVFSYIAKTSPKTKEYICYAYEVPSGQGRQISATVSQAFELAFRRYQEAKDVQRQFQELKEKLKNASPDDKEKIKIEMDSLQAKKIAEESRLQRARDQIRSEAEARAKSSNQALQGATPQTAAAPIPKPPPPQEKKVEPPPPQPEPVPPSSTTEPVEPTQSTEQQPSIEPTATNGEASNGSSNREMEPGPETIQAEVQPAPAPPPVWKRGFDVALTSLEQQIKELEEAFEWRREMERKQRSLLGKDVSDDYLAGIEGQIAQMPGNK